MNPILSAIAGGHSIKKILEYISKSNPEIAEKIESASAYGYPIEKILGYVMKGGKKLIKDLPNASQEDMNIYNRIQYSVNPELKRAAKTAFGAGAIAGSAYLGLGGANLGLEAVEAANEIIGDANIPSEETPSPTPQEGIEKISGKEEISYEPHSILDQMGLKEKIEIMQKAGNNPEAISVLLDKITTPQQKKWLKENTGKSISEIVDEYLKEPKKDLFDYQVDDQVLDTKGDLKTVKAKSGSNILVEDKGETSQVKTFQLIPPPKKTGYKELAKLYNDLIAGIESHTGKQVSRNVDLAGFSSDTNQLTYTPHGSDTYLFDEIPEEIAEELKTLLPRKTTGENFIGAWESGTESPIGAQMSAIIQRLKKERKKSGKKEYSAKFSQIYDAFKPAIEAAKRLKKEKREEEKRKKRR